MHRRTDHFLGEAWQVFPPLRAQNEKVVVGRLAGNAFKLSLTNVSFQVPDGPKPDGKHVHLDCPERLYRFAPRAKNGHDARTREAQTLDG